MRALWLRSFGRARLGLDGRATIGSPARKMPIAPPAAVRPSRYAVSHARDTINKCATSRPRAEEGFYICHCNEVVSIVQLLTVIIVVFVSSVTSFPPITMNFIIPAKVARKNLGELLDRAYYQGTPFLVTRGKRAVAAVVGAKEFQSYLKYLEAHDPGLADTLAIMSNPEVQAILEEGEAAVKANDVVSLEEVLSDK